MSFARAGIVKTTSCVAARNLNIKRRAAAEPLEFDPIGLARVGNVEMRDVGTAGRLFS